ncbi:MAG: substrate-binding domain-containing protein [Flavobacteriaceae bacterium]|nr:substrate-binding domain-containing protein [Flavobacteriaceae bacterium]
MQKITIGGVPEHFNLPWHLAIEKGLFKKKGIDLQWKEFPGGTGDMCSALRDGSIDIAIILTEGIIKDIINGNPSKIVKVYVQSPLLWGIHVAANSNFTTIQELENASIAISRYGSGSQLMAKVNAHTHGFDIDNLQYKIVKTLDGGIKALSNGTADYFLWEHFTTKPYVDKGIFRRIDNITTPWPCFVMAVRDEVLEHQKTEISTIIKIINKQLGTFKGPLENDDLIQLFSERYHQKTKDITNWLSITKWNSKKFISKKLINNIQNKLVQFNIIESSVPSNQLIKKML